MLKQFIVVVMGLVLAAGAVVATAAYLATPTVVVKNQASVEVDVTARWNRASKALGVIPPGASRTFKTGGEAAMSFDVGYPAGQRIATERAYFTTATIVTALVTDASVKVSTRLRGGDAVMQVVAARPEAAE
ncbi:hypothetical protein DN824_01780 [Stutzerimonas nosocomialis]|uniref:hypothetical protein n=1 Tax=Stutzerimonas nosocomialis TaxID=1056496 RepID=UPI001108C278|nr:hypothetical protein [Stutzerimonas nosocomialis]TLX61052.1 hypothetical protein DN824_01780 [Stutzerimonas nosocomialis]